MNFEMIGIEDISKVAQKKLNLQQSLPKLSNTNVYYKTSNERCANIVDDIFDKIFDLMSKDTKKSSFEKKLIVNGAKGLKGSVKKYIMLDLSINDAEDILERVKEELNS